MTTASSAREFDKIMKEVRAYVRANGIMVRQVTLFEENQFLVYRYFAAICFAKLSVPIQWGENYLLSYLSKDSKILTFLFLSL